MLRTRCHWSRRPLFVVILCLSSTFCAHGQKKTVTLEADLPRITYEIKSTATDLITSAELFAEFAQKVRGDIGRITGEYKIEDKTTLKRFKKTLLALELLDGNADTATTLINELRDLEDKPAAKLLSGLSAESQLAARKAVEGTRQDDPEFRRVFREIYESRIDQLPWAVVQAELKQTKGAHEIRSRNLYLGMIQSSIEPALMKTGTFGRDVAEMLVQVRFMLENELPLKAEIVAALSNVIAKHEVKKPSIWGAREIELTDHRDLTPVVLAVWDSGVDMQIFVDRSYSNPRETLNGKDDDENGYVDDLHGIAYDLVSEKEVALLYPLEDAKDRLPKMKDQIKGLLDIRSAIDSAEASALKRSMSQIQPEEVKPFIEDLNRFGNFSHGTHVAGIMAKGNPAARLLPARLTFDYRMIPIAPTIELAKKEAAMYRDSVAYFQKAQVRVVNMSWGGSRKDIEQALEANGIEKDATKRAELAAKIFEIQRNGLYEALKNAPEILFVCAAGNSDNDNQFEELIPSSFALPNMLTVGAVDQAGDRTSFTTFGENVEVYANGYEVESYIPGGDRMPFSGTSMASPNVANLAGKIFALNPKLSPIEVIELIKNGIEKGGNENFPLIHSRNTINAMK